VDASGCARRIFCVMASKFGADMGSASFAAKHCRQPLLSMRARSGHWVNLLVLGTFNSATRLAKEASTPSGLCLMSIDTWISDG
jgi:hypothetical protein